MKKYILITKALLLLTACSILAQDIETKQEPIAEKMTYQQSLLQLRSTQTLGETIRGPVLESLRKPLIIVDGIVSTEEDETDPMDIKVSDISEISVVKDPIQLAIYGPKGADGVILITTKHAKVTEP